MADLLLMVALRNLPRPGTAQPMLLLCLQDNMAILILSRIRSTTPLDRVIPLTPTWKPQHHMAMGLNIILATKSRFNKQTGQTAKKLLLNL